MCRLRNIALESVTKKFDRRTDRRTDGRTDDGQSDPYVSLCFAGDTKMYLTDIKIISKLLVQEYILICSWWKSVHCAQAVVDNIWIQELWLTAMRYINDQPTDRGWDKINTWVCSIDDPCIILLQCMGLSIYLQFHVVFIIHEFSFILMFKIPKNIYIQRISRWQSELHFVV